MFAFVQQRVLRNTKLDFAGVQLAVDGFVRTFGNGAGDLNDVFAAEFSAFFHHFGTRLGCVHNLNQSVAVPQIDEYGAPVVAITVDPAAKGYRFTNVGRA